MRAHSLVVAAAIALPCVAQTTWVVNSAGGGNFTAIQPAIAAASPGDRIEVQGTGPYGAFLVDRGVDVDSAAGALTGTIEVVGLPAGQTARVTGFAVDQTGNGFVSVRSCPGNVMLAHVGFIGPAAVPALANPGLEVLDSPCVFVNSCSFRGHDDTTNGAPGAKLTNSRVTIVSGWVQGGVRISTLSFVGNSGRTGIELVSGHTNLRGTVVHGGPSTSGTSGGGNGGDALGVTSGAALVLGQSQLLGAPGSFGALVIGADGWSARGNVHYGNDTLLVGPAWTATAIPNRPTVSGPGGVLIGTTLTWLVNGAPGQSVWLGLDLGFTYDTSTVADSALVMTPVAVLLAPITLSAQGTGSLPIPIPNNPALRHLDVFVQSAAVVAGALVVGPPAVTRTQ